MKGRIHSLETYGTVDGPGIRFVVFFQGCPLQCIFCHNRDTWDVFGGSVITTGEIIEEFKKYLDFYRRSGGGLTASGGEPTLQPEFLGELFRKVKELGLNTALNTTGFVDIDTAELFLGFSDLVMLDLKVMDSEKHKEITGVTNEKIVAFARHLAERKKPVWIRHVVVPGLTDDEEDAEAMVSFIKEVGNVTKVELLPYHTFGEEKWRQLGCSYSLKGIRPARRDLLEKLARNYDSLGVQVTIE